MLPSQCPDDTEWEDDDLARFEREGASGATLQVDRQYHVEHDGVRIWCATCGVGPPVVMLHGGLGHAGNWERQVNAVAKAHQAVLIDTRGHGRSTRDDRPLSYDVMADDVLAVLDALGLEKAAFVGWSDGACVALHVAAKAPSRVTRVFFFACNMDLTGTKGVSEGLPILQRCLNRHKLDYGRLSPTPGDFNGLALAVQLMQQTQPNFSANDLQNIRVPVAIVQSEHDEFIKLEHAEYLAQTIPGAVFVLLRNVSHFAPLQRPGLFSEALLSFLNQEVT